MKVGAGMAGRVQLGATLATTKQLACKIYLCSTIYPPCTIGCMVAGPLDIPPNTDLQVTCQPALRL